MEEEVKSFTIRSVSLRALLIFKDGNFAITSIKTFMMKLKDGSFVTFYPDNYFKGERKFFLLRVDREKNAVVYTEKGNYKTELPRNIL